MLEISYQSWIALDSTVGQNALSQVELFKKTLNINGIILNKLETLKSSLMESAYDLGASKLQAFWYVMLPNIKLSLIIAGLLAFTISLDETLITLFLIGNDTTWPIKLWAKMRVGFSKQVNASVTLILILTSFLVLLIATIVSRSEKRIMY